MALAAMAAQKSVCTLLQPGLTSVERDAPLIPSQASLCHIASHYNALSVRINIVQCIWTLQKNKCMHKTNLNIKKSNYI